MTSQEDLTKYLDKMVTGNYMFHYVAYTADIFEIMKVCIKADIKHNIIMIMGENNNNHWVYFHGEQPYYYFDAYGIWPNAYQLMKNYNWATVYELEDKKREIKADIIKKAKKAQYDIFYNEQCLQNNMYGILQGEYTPTPTDTCGQFCCLTAFFVEEYNKLYDIDKFIITRYNYMQARLTELNKRYISYDAVAKIMCEANYKKSI